jgi:hypothetical protein
MIIMSASRKPPGNARIAYRIMRTSRFTFAHEVTVVERPQDILIQCG